MQLMVTFSSQLTISLLYKLAIHRAIFRPTLRHQNTDATSCDITAACNHAHLGTQYILVLSVFKMKEGRRKHKREMEIKVFVFFSSVRVVYQASPST